MREHRKVAVREGGLAVGNRIERDARPGDDALAVALGDVAMFGDPFRLEAVGLHARCCRADLVLRFERDPLRFETAVIDARVDVEFGEAAVHMRSEEHTSELQSLMRSSN